MLEDLFDRRHVLAAGAGLAAAGALPGQAPAQTGGTNAAALPPRGDYVIRGAQVLTLEHNLGDFPRGEVRIRNGEIASVGIRVNDSGAEVIDAAGMICMPGFVDTHWHLWTSVLRPVMRLDDPDYGYFPVTNRLGIHYQPSDSYRAVRLGLVQALAAGVTTVHNWAHNVRSPAHADAELAAMRDTGVRGRFSYGTPQGAANDQPMDLADLARLARDWNSAEGLLTLGMCSRNVGDDPNPLRGSVSVEMAKKEWGAVRELGLPITLHTSGPSPIGLLDAAGLLGPDVQLVHPLLTTAEERAILRERGTKYSTSPIGEATRPAAAGVIQLGELLESGVKVSMSIDHTTTANCDCFACMRMLYALHQHRIGRRIPLTTRRLVELATIDGAHDLGLDRRIGSLAPGNRADLILIRTGDVNLSPVGDPYDALVSLAEPGNVDTVMVDGRILRRHGRFTALDHSGVLAHARETVDDLRARANWPT
ncbi:amidohydrolase family protein [Xanthobacteraceae bacterium Astr-EGSB]|uniref:amidohydrolase family protein n=1 Tax=Astrobacterium formosum TaxID=3069710 RepID=UPI0027B658EB|nr:amidohydrolase family protein [Xanthobacteraceae bacterium Astr-EGSB]